MYIHRPKPASFPPLEDLPADASAPTRNTPSWKPTCADIALLLHMGGMAAATTPPSPPASRASSSGVANNLLGHCGGAFQPERSQARRSAQHQGHADDGRHPAPTPPTSPTRPPGHRLPAPQHRFTAERFDLPRALIDRAWATRSCSSADPRAVVFKNFVHQLADAKGPRPRF